MLIKLGKLGKLGGVAGSGLKTIMNIFSTAPVLDSGSWKFKGGDFDAVVGNEQVGTFDGIDDFAELATGIEFAPGSSVVMYVNLNNVISTSLYLFGCNVDSLGFRYNGSSFLMANVAASTAVRAVNWTKVNEIVKLEVYNVNDLDYIVYINDVLIGTTGQATSNRITIKYIAKRQGSLPLFFNGIISEVVIAGQIVLFNQRNGAVAYNLTNPSNNATINGITTTFWTNTNNGLKPWHLTNGVTVYKNDADPTKYIDITGDNSLTISGYTKEAYYPAGSGMIKALTNNITIPTDATLNAIIAAGTYTWAQLDALVTTVNLRITKTATQITRLLIKI